MKTEEFGLEAQINVSSVPGLGVGKQAKTVNKTVASTFIVEDRESYLEGVKNGERYKKAFDFVQRKVEFENFKFKYPTLVGVVLESVDVQVTDTQRKTGSINFRFHISQSLSLGEISEVIKFKVNSLIPDQEE